jgi:hypothetical protein
MESEFYLQARREWDERYGDLVLGKRNWQITSAGLMLLSLGARRITHRFHASACKQSRSVAISARYFRVYNPATRKRSGRRCRVHPRRIAGSRGAWRHFDGKFMPESEKFEADRLEYERDATGGRARAEKARRAPDGTFIAEGLR